MVECARGRAWAIAVSNGDPTSDPVDVTLTASRLCGTADTITRTIRPVQMLSASFIGLGVTGLSDALLMTGLRYGSDVAAEATGRCLGRIAQALGLDLRAERLGRFPLEGRYDPDFTRGVFALDAPGDITPVLTSGFGWHVARLQSKDPALNRSFEEVEAELRARIAPEVRTLKLRELGATLARQSGSELFPEILDEAEAQRAGP